MKKTLKAISQFTAVAILGTVVMTSCSPDKDSPGVEYMPDMYRSPSIEPFVDYAQVRNVENTNGKSNMLSAMTPVEGTVPFYGSSFKHNMPFAYLPTPQHKETHGLTGIETDANGYENSKAAVNPIMLHAGNQKEILKEAKHIYENNCIHCHGEKGDGKGSIVKTGKYTGVPDYKTLTDLADGQLMYSISYGKGMMGAHMTQLSVEERWMLVHYVNALQNGGKADLNGDLGFDMSDSLNTPTNTVVLKDVFFNFGSASINSNRRNKSLFTLLNFMSTNEASIELAGHTDNVGTPEGNLTISQERAESIKTFLVEYGISAERISTVGYGLTKPVADNATDEGRAMNRRTEVRILK